MPLIQLSPTTTRRLSSSQVISSVCDAVKELVENALDSGATAIHVKLVNYGLDSITVEDNGSGVPVTHMEHICLPHFTSKINQFSDLENKLETYGFRGEALASLCNVADVSVTTRTQSDEYAQMFTFDKDGKVINSKPSHYRKGTTVTVLNIFSNLPVRKKFMTSSNKSKTEFKKTEIMVKNFAVINTGVYFSFYHNKCIVWQKSPAQTLKESVKSVLGYSVANQMEEVSTAHKKSGIVLVLPNKYCKEIALLCAANVEVIRIFINKRPVKYSKLQKIVLKCISEYFASNYPRGKYPTCIMDIQMASCDLDVNIEPNKTKVMCHEEDELVAAVEKLFEAYYKPSEKPNVSRQPQLDEERRMQSTKSLPKQQTSEHDTRNVTNLVVEQQSVWDTKDNEVRNSESVVEPALPILQKDDLWILADNAMGLWSKDSVKSTSGDVIKNKLREEQHCNGKKSEVQKYVKRPRLEEEREKQTTFKHGLASNVGQNIVLNSAIDQQTVCDLNVVSEMKNMNSVVELSVPVKENNDLWASNDNDMGLWSRGSVTSALGDIIEGAATLLQPKCSNVNSESIKKMTEIANTNSKSNFETAKKDGVKKFNSSFHTVSSQMGCKEMSGFTNFCRQMRPKIVQQNPGICFTDVAKALSDKWRDLTSDEQHCYDINRQSVKPITSSKVQNRSLIAMFEKPVQNRIKNSTTWHISVDDWKIIPQPQITENIPSLAKFKLLHLLMPEEIWICKRNLDIGIIRPWCLQEKIIYKQLMEYHSVPVIPMDKPLLLKQEDFEPELWQCLTCMKVEKQDPDTFQVVCPTVTKNGFMLMWKSGELYITHVASTVRYYGIEELQEILTYMKNSSHLIQCRPIKISAYLENEAVRISNEKRTAVNREKMTEFLEMWNDLEDNMCLHQKPIFKLLYTPPQTSSV